MYVGKKRGRNCLIEMSDLEAAEAAAAVSGALAPPDFAMDSRRVTML
jgi:hypothetical protein